jgi:uroporphyrinogen decarboxylase
MPPDKINHRERMERCLNGDELDVVPVSFWRHFPVDDQTPDGLAASTAAFQRLYDLDFIKVTPSSSFCLKDWGVQDRWNGSNEGTREYIYTPIKDPEDISKLSLLDPASGYLGSQLICLQLLKMEFSPYTPLVQTIFSPLSQAKNLLGRDHLTVFMRQQPDALHQLLDKITINTLNFLDEVIKVGVDGIFYAVQQAQYALLTEEEFLSFGRSYDFRILQAAQSLWMNIAHIHGENLMFNTLSDYPVSILNWHDRQTYPSLPLAQKLYQGIVCGGLSQWDTMVLGSPDQVKEEARDAIQSTSGKRFILGTGCVLPVTAPHTNIMAARQSVYR